MIRAKLKEARNKSPHENKMSMKPSLTTKGSCSQEKGGKQATIF